MKRVGVDLMRSGPNGGFFVDHFDHIDNVALVNQFVNHDTSTHRTIVQVRERERS